MRGDGAGDARSCVNSKQTSTWSAWLAHEHAHRDVRFWLFGFLRAVVRRIRSGGALLVADYAKHALPRPP